MSYQISYNIGSSSSALNIIFALIECDRCVMEPLPYLKEISLKRELINTFDDYPFALPVVKELDSIEFAKGLTIFVGENGSGKSTLLEAIALGMGFNAEGGSKNFNFSTQETHSSLYKYLRFSKSYKRYKDGYFLRAESFYNVASNIENLDINDPELRMPHPPPIKSYYGGVSLHKQSHGESFLSLMVERFYGRGFYLLDEPEAALSPIRQMAALSRIHDLIKLDSQFIIATHSPILMAYPGALIYQIDSTGITPIKYEDTEHYGITKAFLNDPDLFLKDLLSE